MSKKNEAPSEEQVDHGIGYVVDHKTAGARYAVSPQNLDERVHTKVRPLKLTETVRGFRPKRIDKDKAASPADVAQASPPAAAPADAKDNTK